MRLVADRHRAGLHNPDHLLLVEIDDREEPFDWAAPDILCAGGVEARHSDEAPALLARIAAGTSGQWRAKQLRRIDRHIAAPLHRRAPFRIGDRYFLRVAQLVETDRGLHIRHRVPAFELAGCEIDNALIDNPLLPHDDKGLAREGLPGMPGEDSLFVRLGQRDQRKAGRGVGMPRRAQHAYRGADLRRGEGIERMR